MSVGAKPVMWAGENPGAGRRGWRRLSAGPDHGDMAFENPAAVLSTGCCVSAVCCSSSLSARSTHGAQLVSRGDIQEQRETKADTDEGVPEARLA